MKFIRNDLVRRDHIATLIVDCGCGKLHHIIDSNHPGVVTYTIHDDKLVAVMTIANYNYCRTFHYLFCLPEYRHKVNWKHAYSLIPTGEYSANVSVLQYNMIKKAKTLNILHVERCDGNFPYFIIFEKVV